MTERGERVGIELLEGLIVLSALGGAVGLVGGGIDFPLAWLEGTPFASYLVPGLVLGLVVGGSALAAAALMLARHPLAAPASLGAGLVQVGWIVGEVVFVGTPGPVALWLQVAYFAVGAALAAAAAHLWLRAPRPVA